MRLLRQIQLLTELNFLYASTEESIVSETPRITDKKIPRQKSASRIALRIILWIVLLAIGIPLLAGIAVFAPTLVDRKDPARYIPSGFDFYASTSSASNFAVQVLNLKALDAALSGTGTQGLRSTVRSLRANPFLQTKQFRQLANVRADAAYYPGGDFVAVAELGWRSGLTRLAQLFGKQLTRWILPVKGLEWNPDSIPKRFEYHSGENTVYVAAIKNLLIASSSESLFTDALGGTAFSEEVQMLMAEKARGNLRILVNTASLLAETAAGSGPVPSLLRAVSFPALSVADLDLSDSAVRLILRAKAESSDPAVSTLLGKRSRTPAALSAMPESVEYFSLLAAGSPGFLWANFSGKLGEQALAAKDSADKAAKLLLGKTSDEILFSWMGDEVGVFGTAFGPAPVFFVKISDEKARRLVFDEVLGSLVAGRDISATVNGVRIPRIIFPDFIDGFLKSLGIDLVEPFYMTEGGFLFASSSAETLAACVEQMRGGKLLSKTGRWDSSAGRVSAESSMMAYYDLGRSSPFFLRSSKGISAALKLYNRGAFSVSFRNGELRIEIAAVRESTAGASEVAGFPADSGSRMMADPVCAISPQGEPMAYWTGKDTVEAMNLSSGERFSADMDASGLLCLALSGKTTENVWAVSERGTVYCLDPNLGLRAGFPLVTGQSPTGIPSISKGRLLVPVSEGPSIMIVSADATKTFSASLHAKLRSRPVSREGQFAALPRSFDSMLYLFDPAGSIAAGWPARLEGLASAEPVIAPGLEGGSIAVGAVSEAGSFSLYGADGIPLDGFPANLDGVFDAAPVWSASLSSFLLLSTDGLLWRVGRDGKTEGPARIQNIKGRNSRLLVHDADGDGREEIFIGNDGNTLQGLRPDFSSLPGFPLAGSGLPAFLDIDGDGGEEIICRSANDMIHAYKAEW